MKKSIKITLGLGIIGLLYFLLKKDKLTPEKFIKEKLKLVDKKHLLIEEIDKKRLKDAVNLGNSKDVENAKAIKDANAKKAREEKARLEKAKRGAEALQLTKAEQKRLQKLEDAENRRQQALEAERRRIAELEILREEIRNEKQDRNDRGYGGIKPLLTRSADNKQGGSDFEDLGLEFDMPTIPRPRTIGTSRGLGVGFAN